MRLLIEVLFKLLVLASFAVGMFSCLPVVDKVLDYVEPLYLKCLTYSALRYVLDDNPSGTVTISVINNEIRLRCIRPGEMGGVTTITVVPKEQVQIVAKDGGAITLSPTTVLRAGSVVSKNWTLSFPPVVLKMNIKR
ncbi:hypothetical protein [Pseudothermotoga sp.]